MYGRQQGKQERLTALLQHVDVALLRSVYGWLHNEATAVVDGVTCEEYDAGLEQRLADLHGRIHRGTYRAQPSRRVYIPKADGRQRPLGIAMLEDNIVQRALVELLNAIWEEDFPGFSYGFRPRHGPDPEAYLHSAMIASLITNLAEWQTCCPGTSTSTRYPSPSDPHQAKQRARVSRWTLTLGRPVH